MLLLLLACLPTLDPEKSGSVETGLPTVDADGDGFDDTVDCDDLDAEVFPGADEVCNGEDDDCDGVVPEEELDGDGDGMSACDGDCDDTREDVYAGAEEPCDYTDNDCDGEVDEEGLTVFYEDADGDAFGNVDVPTDPICGAPEGYVADGTDCDDANAEANPGTDELCATGFDDDCDGDVNEDDAADVPTWYLDSDEDSYGDPAYSWVQCEALEGTVSSDQDCDDADPDIHPQAEERCNGLDDDCDGAVPTDETDDDGDGFVECTGEDCDDSRDDVYLGADEYCNTGVDEDCDGSVDEDDDAVDVSTWYADSDGDGDGDGGAITLACNQPSGHVGNSDDCDDGDDTVYDGASELCDGQDNDCDGSLDATEGDDDGDGYVECTVDSDGWDGSTITGGEDCDDGRALTNPGATEYCNTHDDDCDGTVDEDDAVDALTWYDDDDGDGFGDANASQTSCSQPTGTVSDDTDCEDSDSSTYPNAAETCGDGVINDCNASSTDECGPYGSWTLDDTPIAVYGDGYSDYAGSVVESGDVDQDGNADLLLIAPYDGYGEVGVFYGPVTTEWDMADADLSVSGAIADHKDDTQYHYVSQVHMAGDLMGSGDDTLVVAVDSYGAVYLFDSPSSGSLDINDNDVYLDIDTDRNGDMGDELASADLDDDGNLDLIMGAPSYDYEYGDEYWQKYYNRGAVWVAYGPITASRTRVDTDHDDSVIHGRASYAAAGASLASGDLTGDGVDDMVVGAPTSSTSAGTCQVGVIGDLSSGTSSTLASSSDWYLEASNRCGSAVGVGDQNDDGYLDLAVGAEGSNAVYLFNGPLSGSAVGTGSADATVSGPSGGVLGDAVDLSGDVDDDGYDDLVAGSWASSSYKGVVYMHLGPLSGSVSAGSAAGTWTGGSNYDYASLDQSLSFVGDVSGNGYDDIAVGATREDSNSTNAGAAWLMVGGPNY